MQQQNIRVNKNVESRLSNNNFLIALTAQLNYKVWLKTLYEKLHIFRTV